MKLAPEKQKNLILTVMLTVIVIVGSYYFGPRQLYSNKIRDSKMLKDLIDKVKTQEQVIAKEKRDSETAKAYQAYIIDCEEKMPKGNTETWLLTELNGLAERHHLKLANTVIRNVSDLSDFKFKDLFHKLVGYHFEFKGEFNQIGKFLRDLENQKLLMEIDEISITSGSDVAPHVHTVAMRVLMVTKS